MTKHFAQRHVDHEGCTLNDADTIEIKTSSIDLHEIIYRSEKDSWEGPYNILDVGREYCTLLLLLPSGL